MCCLAAPQRAQCSPFQHDTSVFITGIFIDGCQANKQSKEVFEEDERFLRNAGIYDNPGESVATSMCVKASFFFLVCLVHTWVVFEVFPVRGAVQNSWHSRMDGALTRIHTHVVSCPPFFLSSLSPSLSLCVCACVRIRAYMLPM